MATHGERGNAETIGVGDRGPYLLVADRTAESDELLAAASEIQDRDPGARFVLLVPATPVRHRLVWEEGETEEAARRAADAAVTRLRSCGLPVIEVQVADADPVEALGDELRRRRHRYQAVVVSTLPAGASRWLRLDVLSRIRRRYLQGRSVQVDTTRPADCALLAT